MGFVALKRVNKELDDFYSEKYFSKYSENIQKYFRTLDLQIYAVNSSNTDSEHYILKITNKNTNTLLLECHIPKSYPFKPYVVTKFRPVNINNKIGYYRFLSLANSKKNKIYDKKILKFFYKLQYGYECNFLKLSDTTCFCCSSITCCANWNPSSKIDYLILEYLEAQFIINYNQPYSYLKLLNTYNGLFELFNFYKLPNEIIEIILSHF